MKKIAQIILLISLSSWTLAQNQIIADHTIVADYDKIPAYYIAEVKKMLVSFPGASHSAAYRSGLTLLEAADSRFQVNVAYEESYKTTYLRCNNIGRDMLDDEWYTWYAWPSNARPATAQTIKNIIKRNYDNNHPISVMGLGWCWFMMSSYTSQTYDPTHKVRWWGSTHGGPEEGIHGWGLNQEDYSITGNSVCMDTYLNATLDYINYCLDNDYLTKIVFTTGPVDKYKGEQGYQTYVKHEYIRNFVKADPSRILFDYADILCYDDNGTINNESWTQNGVTYTYPFITDNNLGDGSLGHIGPKGALRLGKAIWWMLARIAGWDGESGITAVTNPSEANQPLQIYQQTDKIFVELKNTTIPENHYSIYSIQGILYHQDSFANNRAVIDTGSYPPGIYIFSIPDSQIAPCKLVIQ